MSKKRKSSPGSLTPEEPACSKKNNDSQEYNASKSREMADGIEVSTVAGQADGKAFLRYL